MSFLLIVAVLALALFALTLITKRRFGVLGLALSAGALLSTLWVGNLTPLIERAGFSLTVPPLSTVVAAGLILLPAVLLLTGGPVYHSKHGRLIGSVLFSALAIALLIPVLGSALVIDATAKPIYDFIVQYRPQIVTIGLVTALLDVILTRSHTSAGKAKH